MSFLGALLSCAAITCAYVAPIFLFCRGKHRDDPHTILARSVCVLAASALACLPLRHLAPPHRSLPTLLGLSWRGSLPAVAASLAHCSLLFAAPLADRWARRGTLPGSAGQPRRPTPLMLARTLIMAPLSEEFCFRGCMMPLLLTQGASPAAAITLPPLFFGAAHLHHLYELRVHSRLPMRQAVIQVGAMFVYTSLFGGYAAFLFLRTRRLAAPMAVHVFCNWMGLPDFRGMLTHPTRARHLGALLTIGIAGFLCTFTWIPRWEEL